MLKAERYSSRRGGGAGRALCFFSVRSTSLNSGVSLFLLAVWSLFFQPGREELHRAHHRQTGIFFPPYRYEYE